MTLDERRIHIRSILSHKTIGTGILIGGVLIAGALIAVCYGYALGLPFYFDDLPVLTWLSGRGLDQVWTTSSENAYYRPLTFTIYAFGLLFRKGVQQVVLHAANLVLHWTACALVMLLVRRCTPGPTGTITGLLAAVLYALFPFFFRALPWVTAMPHFLVIVLTLAAALAALRAVEEDAPAWWAPGLLAAALAPFAHESGLVCGAIVGGLVIIQRGFRLRRWDVAGVLLGGVLNAGALLLRARIPGAGSFLPDGLNSAYENVFFALQGLLYPLGPAIGLLAHRYGWHDFALIGGAAGGLAALLVVLGIQARDWKWIARSLWWWAWGMLPVTVRFRYGGLVNSPRFYALAAAGIVMLWAEILVRIAQMPQSHHRTNSPPERKAPTPPGRGLEHFQKMSLQGRGLEHFQKMSLQGRGLEHIQKMPLQGRGQEAFRNRAWARGLVGALLIGALIASNVSFLWAQRGVHRAIAHVYQQILEAAEDKGNAPLGFVNVPAWLTPRDQTYALSKDGAVMLPLYTTVRRYIAVNRQERAADNVMYVHVLQEPEDIWWGFHGDWLDGEQMRQFAVEHRSVWLARWEGQGRAGRFELHHVGAIVEDQPLVESPLARFEGGPALESASVQRQDSGHWTITLTWSAKGPTEANVFVHVIDAARNLVAQADGPALGGMVPLSVWRPGDRVVDVRRLTLPDTGGPYTVLVGVYNAGGRLPAFVEGARQPDDAALAAEISP